MMSDAGNAFPIAPQLLSAAFEEHPCAAILYDEIHTIRAINRAGRDLLGTEAANWVGRRCEDAFGCDRCEPACGLAAALRRGSGVTNGKVRVRSAAGVERQLAVKLAVLQGHDGRVQGAIALITGISGDSRPRGAVVAESAAMRSLMTFTRRVASSEAASILLQGENGTGKDVIAQMLHYESSRCAEPFVSINCAAMPETLLESELFGYEKGAFTDARSMKRGLMELANRGTLFLDEIVELPLKLQAKMLRVLEDQTFRRLGGVTDITIDVRIVAATNRDLHAAVTAGEFRQDLYYRLNVIQIWIPPLRERIDDILPLAHHFVGHYNHKFGRQITGICSAAENALLRHDWPGNVRELRNAIERAIILEDAELIRVESLPEHIGELARRPPNPSHDREIVPLEKAERMLLERAMEKCNGVQTRAAEMLGISRDTLRYRLKKFGLIDRDSMTACA